jgi:hypothetical protein
MVIEDLVTQVRAAGSSTKSTCRTVLGLGYRASMRTSEILATVVPEEWEDAQVPDGLWDLLLRPAVGNVCCQVLRGSEHRGGMQREE